MGEIYQPAEDSYFFAEFLEKYVSKLKNKNISYLDMGAGTGILSEIAEKFLERSHILAVDINPDAIDLLRKRGFKTIQSNLFDKIFDKFDLITFNAPYLPEDSREPEDSRIATTGGKKGDEISVKFLREAKKHLKKEGKIFLLVSSLTPSSRIEKLGGKIVAKKKIPFEELLIFEVSC